MTDEERLVWRRFEKLERRVLEQGQSLELGDETRTILSEGAQFVAISPTDIEDALRGISTATTLLREISRRLDEGSKRQRKSYSQVDRLREQGDFAGARKVLEDALAVEIVPYYREQLEIRLEHLATLETVFATGHIEADFHPWEQIRVLALRVQQGKPLELREDMRDFLRQTAPSVAISEAEAEEALKTREGAESLLAKMMERIGDGRQRIKQALTRMMNCQEAGDPEGARQAMRDVLAVEIVPQYRQMAEECLKSCDKPPLDW
jgi:DUSAM domain-containing protein